MKVRGSEARDDVIASMLQEHSDFGGYDQFIPGQRRDITYVSRLQCVQV